MPMKTAPKKQRKPFFLSVILYRIPMPVTEALLFSRGDSYPICPRCNSTIDREYMNFCDSCGQRLFWEQFRFAEVIHAPCKKC